jgi:outer membrane lipoprotein-sorting protein
MQKPSLTLVAASLLLVGAGCSFGLSGKSTAKNADTAAPAPAAPTAVTDAAVALGACPYDDKTLCKFLTNWKVSANMSMRTKATVDGKNTSSSFETDGKGSSRMSYAENGKEQYAAITIGKTMYSRQADEKIWTKTVMPDQPADGHPPGDAEGTVKFDFSEEGDAGADTQSYVAIGKEACGKLNCFKYEATVKNSAEKQHIWFDDKEYRLRRLKDFAQDGTTTDTEFSYDAVVIVAPSPVQEIDLNKMMGSPEDQKAIEEQLKALQGQMPTE